MREEGTGYMSQNVPNADFFSPTQSAHAHCIAYLALKGCVNYNMTLVQPVLARIEFLLDPKQLKHLRTPWILRSVGALPPSISLQLSRTHLLKYHRTR